MSTTKVCRNVLPNLLTASPLILIMEYGQSNATQANSLQQLPLKVKNIIRVVVLLIGLYHLRFGRLFAEGQTLTTL